MSTFRSLCSSCCRAARAGEAHQPKSVISFNAFLVTLLLVTLTLSVSAYHQTAGVGDNRSCLIGRLRQCNDDEDCVENAPEPRPMVQVSVVQPNETEPRHLISAIMPVTAAPIERWGTCTCRHRTMCMRTEHLKQMAAAQLEMHDHDGGDGSSSSGRAYRQHDSDGNTILSLIFVAVIGVVAAFGFLVYHYGFRQELFSYYARQGVRFVNGFAHTEDTGREQQLLHRGEEELSL